MSIFTQNSINAVNTFPCAIYYDNISLGILEDGEVTVTIDSDIEGVASHATGTNGHFLAINKGTHAQIEFTLRNFDKNILTELFYSQLTGEDTSDTNWKAGQMKITSNPKVINKTAKPLVIYPLVDDGTAKFKADDTNPLAMLFPNFVVTDTLEIPMTTENVLDITVTGEGQVDILDADFLVGVVGVGIEPDGTYTEPTP